MNVNNMCHAFEATAVKLQVEYTQPAHPLSFHPGTNDWETTFYSVNWHQDVISIKFKISTNIIIFNKIKIYFPPSHPSEIKI